MCMNLYPFLILSAACAELSDLEAKIDLPSHEWCAQNRTETVVSVYDGDTVDLLGEGEKIRFLGVAAPEVENSAQQTPAECYAEESREYLERLVVGQQVQLEFDIECQDIYNRTLAWVVLHGDDSFVAGEMAAYSLMGLEEDGSYSLVVNELLVRAGYAQLFDGDVAQNIRYSSRLEEAETQAETAGLGLWSACQ